VDAVILSVHALCWNLVPGTYLLQLLASGQLVALVSTQKGKLDDVVVHCHRSHSPRPLGHVDGAIACILS
jgi:hypothetical protein